MTIFQNKSTDFVVLFNQSMVFNYRPTNISRMTPITSFQVFPVTMDFTGKVVVITGASSGIGSASAIYFAKLGAKLALCGRNEEKLKDLAKKCEFFSKVEPLVAVGDLTVERDVKSIVENTLKYFLIIDVLVNSAGIIEMGNIHETSLEQFDRLFNINVRSMFYITQLAVPYLIKSKGAIVNVSSVNGVRAFPGVLVYNMTKAAVDQFTNTLALELAPKQVRVNSVNPGVTKTELHKRSGMDEDTYAEFLERCKETHALGRPGNPEEVASAIAFLASSQSSFITGVNLCVDGGRHAMCPR